MAMSGVKLHENAKAKCDEVFNKKGDKACVFKISDDKKFIQVDEDFKCSCDEKRPFKKCLEMLKEDNCRYALTSVNYKDTEGKRCEKVVCINWASDKAKVSDKMLSTSSFEALKKNLNGVTIVQMNNLIEKKASTVLQKVIRKGAPARRFEGKRYHVNKQNREYESSGSDSEAD